MNCIQESSLSASSSAPPEVDPTGTSGDGVSYSWLPLASSCWQAPSSSAMLHCPCSSSTSVQIAFFLKTRHNAKEIKLRKKEDGRRGREGRGCEHDDGFSQE